MDIRAELDGRLRFVGGGRCLLDLDLFPSPHVRVTLRHVVARRLSVVIPVELLVELNEVESSRRVRNQHTNSLASAPLC